MKRLFVLAAFGLMACGGSPTQPSAPPPTPLSTTLSVLVMGHLSARPLVGVPVQLEPIGSGATSDRPESKTDFEGRATWHVEPNQRYTVRVRGQVAINASLLEGDAQWLVSLPE